MQDEEKTKEQLIAELKILRERLSVDKGNAAGFVTQDTKLHRALAWKDFLLGLYEKAFDMEEQELYGYVLDEIVLLTGSTIGFCHLVAENQQAVLLTKWNREALKYCTTSYENHYPISEAGNWVDCVRERRPVVYNDYSQSPNQKGLPSGHNPIQRFMSVPVIEQGKVRIIFGVGNKPDNYDEEDVYHTQIVANSLQFILTRRQAEERLWTSEERLSLTLHATQDGIWDWDIPTMSGYASPNYYAMLGMEADDISLNSEAWWDLIHPDDKVKVRQSMDRVLELRPAEQDPVPFVEFRMRKKDGDWCWILARGKVVAWNNEGRPLRMVGTHTNITERKQAEEALRESEERYRTLFETANDAILLLDEKLIYIDCNSKALEMTQRTRDELLGHNPLEFCPVIQPDGRESQKVFDEYVGAVTVGKAMKFYWQTEKKDGNALELNVSLNTVALGGKNYTQVIARDITEQRKIAGILKANEALRNRLFESSVLPIVIMDSAQFHFIDCNAAAAAIYGFSSVTELLGKTPFDVSAPVQYDGTPSAERVLFYIDRALHDGFTVFEWRHQRPDGIQWDAEVHLVRFSTENATLLQFTLVDITKRKQAQKALQESEGKFRDLVAEAIVGVYLIQDERFRYVNAKFADIFGYSVDELTDKMGPLDVVFPDDVALVRENIQKRIAGEVKDAHYRFRVVKKTGELCHVEVYSSITSYQSQPAIIGMLIDVTEKILSEDALRKSEATLRSVFMATPVGLCIMKGRVFQGANKVWYDLFGYTEEDIIGHTTQMLYENEVEYERVGRELYGNLAECGWASLQTRLRRKDGALRDAMLVAAPLQSGDVAAGTVVTIEDITDHKQAEEDLKYNNSLLSTQLEASMDGILVVDEAGRMISFNQRFVEMWRIPDEVALSRSNAQALHSVHDLLHDPDGFLEKVNYLYAHRDEISREEILLKEGRIFDSYSAPVVGTDGRYYGRIWQFRDITEYKQVQAALQKSEAAYREIFNAVTEAIFIHDLYTGEIVDVNNSMLEMYGYTREETRRLRVEDFSSGQYPYTQEEASELIAKAAGGTPQVFEWCGRKKNGQVFPLEVSLKRAAIAGQECVLAVVRDITERKQAEEALRASERRLNDIIEFLPDATLIIDRDGRVIAWNRAIEVMTGVKKADMLGKGNYEYALPFYGTRRPILIDLALRRNSEMENRYTAMKRYDDVLFGEALTPNLPPGDIHLSATASVLRNADGEVIAAIECIRDNTERHRLEAQLRQAQKMEAIGTLAGGIAHDFNNILASMVGYTELAMMNDKRADLRANYLGQVMQACERAKNLVEQILSFSRQREQQKKPVDTRLIVKEALKLLRSSLPATIKINTQITEKPLTIMADPTQVHQIVMNLCTNAAHAMRENGGVLDVQAEPFRVSAEMCFLNPSFHAGPYVHLMVRDSGHGIDAAILDKIFDPFFTTKSHQGGTGLGLSVVYGIVKSYDGVIQVKSEQGQGATFDIYIPAIVEAVSEKQPEREQAVSRGAESILLVDDEESLVMGMENYLQSLGYHVISLTSSKEALAMVRDNPRRFDLVITDMTMPEMTGLKLSQEILKLNPAMPIILCTGYNESITEAEVEAIGIRAFVLKPVRFRDIARLAREFLDQT
jgi:PAS domain S-box-containing protein